MGKPRQSRRQISNGAMTLTTGCVVLDDSHVVVYVRVDSTSYMTESGNTIITPQPHMLTMDVDYAYRFAQNVMAAIDDARGV